MMEERTIPLDAETKVAERPDDHKTELRLWLRLLTCTTLIESEVRRRLRENFDVTLPRFDLLAQLDRAPNGITLGELSQRMMVTNGNITGLVDRLEDQSLVKRRPSPKDRRVQYVELTANGRKFFRTMARATAACNMSSSPRTAANSSAPWRGPTPTGSANCSRSFRAATSMT
jgi:DNA-binding MarR family transcriptional regulator